MNIKQLFIIIACIIFNLITGNLTLLLMGEDTFPIPDKVVNIFLSISIIACYFFVFRLIHFKSLNIFLLCIISIAVWSFTILISNVFATIFYAVLYLINSVDTNSSTFEGQAAVSFIVIFLMFMVKSLSLWVLSIPTGLVNTIWFILHKKSGKQTITPLSE